MPSPGQSLLFFCLIFVFSKGRLPLDFLSKVCSNFKWAPFLLHPGLSCSTPFSGNAGLPVFKRAHELSPKHGLVFALSGRSFMWSWNGFYFPENNKKQRLGVTRTWSIPIIIIFALLIMNWNQLAVEVMQYWDQVTFYVLTIHFFWPVKTIKTKHPWPRWTITVAETRRQKFISSTRKANFTIFKDKQPKL